jgi:hypothetical protein
MGTVEITETLMKRLPDNIQLDVDIDKLAWLLSLLNDKGEIPTYALKYIVIVAAE